ncbi:bifunctional biotin--[acetyl-CoA-carboxylase] ligase/biotin operon repressor BirA [Sulfuriflexus mobilis]|uniref:bifunctional biotin--[acetyl-CoA-carboxylase] ligase/biotin operon repressor BirA n=1 Tax=Sulfuriflexus mobilis TaxID=1811807 RepID=UPI000F83BE0A|nr:bifunctional biotin--[acetyl-CoA-carboxylase] ligase/biotin operon repressor BirA [Sulfuriflexus mobilis]
MSLLRPLLEQLADGRFHSGEELGQQLGVTRSAVWKTLQQFEALGLDVHAVQGKGYRLSEALDLLCIETILAGLHGVAQEAGIKLDLQLELDSTNAWLMQRTDWHARACLAEYQHAGRGRRGRAWLSPFAANLYLSLGWHFSLDAASLSGLSLAAGVAVMRALEGLGIPSVQLKWPNDIVAASGKLGGILIEMRGETGGPSQVVIGVGLNVRMPGAAAAHIDQPWSDLQQCADSRVSRNALAVAVLSELIRVCQTCEQGGITVYLEDWQDYDVHAGKQVDLLLPDERRITGISRGIDSQGALLLELAGKVQRFNCGEVSLRSR